MKLELSLPGRSGSDRRLVHAGFWMGNLALGQVFLHVLQRSPVSIIPSTFRTRLHVHVALTRRTNGRSLGTFHKAMRLRKYGSITQQITITFFDVLLTVHLSIILVINQLNAQNLVL